MRLLILASIILRNLLRHRRRSLIAIFSVGFGAASLIVASGFIEWMFVDFREATIESQYAHVQVTRPAFHENGRADPFSYLLPGDDAAKGIDGAQHVRSWGPRLGFTGLASLGETTVSFLGEGFDPARDLTGDRSLRIAQGDRLGASDTKKVLVGKGLATLIGAKAGDTLVLLVETPGSGLNAIEVKVAGLFESVSKAYDDSAILVHIGAARELLKVPGAHNWLVYADQTENTGAVADYLRGKFGADFEIRTWDQLAEFYTRAVDLFRQQLDVVRFIVIAIILLGIANTMMMSVMERTGEIGTSMALGINRRSLLGQFVLEGALIGAIGSAVGLLVAIMVALGVDLLQIEMPPPPSLTRGYIAKVLLTPGIVGEAIFISIAATTLASLYPAWKASRMVIVEAIRQNK